jgi:hypothetical protein
MASSNLMSIQPSSSIQQISGAPQRKLILISEASFYPNTESAEPPSHMWAISKASMAINGHEAGHCSHDHAQTFPTAVEPGFNIDLSNTTSLLTAHGVTMWACCECGSASMLCGSFDRCYNCDHIRCEFCDVFTGK